MYTQITCPNCKTPFTAEVHQVIDAEQNPELKQKLLSGQLNLAICPSCGAGGQMGTGLLFHDPAHELFMVYVPQELQINQMEREKLVGQLVQQAMNNIPQEKRRAYMLQPQTVLSMQTFMEKVLETEGITKEMIERQKKQAELLNSLATADNDVVEYLLKERANEIDETFFAMLQSYVDTAAQLNDNSQLIKLTNLRAKLMTETAVGRELEKRQIALHKFNQDAKKQGGLSTKLLLKHILANQEDDQVVDALVMAGQQAVRYELFAQMTHEIEKLEKKKKLAEAQQLISIRERVLKLYEKMQAESRKILGKAEELLNLLKDAPDKETAVRANMQRFDDAFMYLLSMRTAEADQAGDNQELQRLSEIHSLIMKQVDAQVPPEVRLINDLLEAGSPEAQQEVLTQNQAMLTPDLVKMLDGLQVELKATGQKEMDGRITGLKALIQARL